MAARSRWSVFLLFVVLLSAPRAHAQKPTVESVLQSAADYLVKYAQALPAVAAEEDFVQYDTASGQMGTPRRLTADMVLFGIAGGQVTSFRDVAMIDQKAVRPRDDRLLTLLKGDDTSRLVRARQFSEDSVRYYVNPDLHALDEPLLALEFLRKENQARSSFKLDGVKNDKGAQIAVVKFTEQNADRLIQNPENAPAIGKAWIDTASGAVRQTDLSISGRATNFHVSVKYALDPTLNAWLPLEMAVESHVSAQGTGMNNMGGGGGFGGHGAAEGHATYSKYRR
jgi:hypothetical protein